MGFFRLITLGKCLIFGSFFFASLPLMAVGKPFSTRVQEVLDDYGLGAAIVYTKHHCEEMYGGAECFYLLGMLYAQGEQFDLAKKAFDQSISEDSTYVLAYKNLAKVYVILEDVELAESTLLRGIESTSSLELMFDSAFFYFKLKKYALSAEVLKKIIDVDEGNIAAINNLAMIYVDYLGQEVDLIEALELTGKMKHDDRVLDNGVYLGTIGWVEHKNKNYGAAVEYLVKAVNLLPKNALLNYQLGVPYFKSGNIKLAKEHLSSAVETSQEFLGYADAVQMLDSL